MFNLPSNLSIGDGIFYGILAIVGLIGGMYLINLLLVLIEEWREG